MVWIMVALSGALGFGLGLLARRPRGTARRLLSPIEELVDQAALLPVKGILSEKGDASWTSTRTVELEGGIKLVSTEYAPDVADLYHNGVKIRLADKQRARLGAILNERITMGALESVGAKLLEP